MGAKAGVLLRKDFNGIASAQLREITQTSRERPPSVARQTVSRQERLIGAERSSSRVSRWSRSRKEPCISRRIVKTSARNSSIRRLVFVHPQVQRVNGAGGMGEVYRARDVAPFTSLPGRCASGRRGF